MPPCVCGPHECRREDGRYSASGRVILCKKKIVVSRHEPLLDWYWPRAWATWKTEEERPRSHMEPIEDEC